MNRRDFVFSLTATTALSFSYNARAQSAKPPAARTVDAVDTRLGYTLRDPYRWMEDSKDPDWEPWIRAQGAHARRMLDAMPDHDALLRRIGELTGDLPIASRVQRTGAATFVEFRPSGASVPKLYVIERPGAEKKLLVDPEAVKDAGDRP